MRPLFTAMDCGPSSCSSRSSRKSTREPVTAVSMAGRSSTGTVSTGRTPRSSSSTLDRFRDAPLPPVTDVSDLAQVQQFLAASFDPSRTLLGRPQLEELKADLLAAEAAGVLWKFVMVPEPIQNLGPLAASDRYEGYAAERNELLAFIDQSGIQNVAFICADLHGTLVNNLTYQMNPLAAPTPVAAFEIVTGSVAFDAPFGPTLFQIAAGLGLVDPATIAAYNAAPRDAKDTLILKPLIDATLQQFGFPRLGLDVDNAGPKSVQATLVSGDYVRTHTYGWSEFDIDAATGQLTVTTYGSIRIPRRRSRVTRRFSSGSRPS